MEQHPIPQNVTNFQFKLVGDITLKQFGYLAGNLMLAYLATKLNFAPVFIRYPFAGFLVLLGIGLAFVPVEERPLDRWLVSFIKSVYSPTQFVYKKQNKVLDILSQTTAIPTTTTSVSASNTHLHKYVSSNPPVPEPVLAQPVLQPKDKPVAAVFPTPYSNLPKATTLEKWTIGAPIKKTDLSQKPTVPAPEITGKRVVAEDEKTVLVQKSPVPVENAKQVEKIKADYQKNTQSLNEKLLVLQKELQQGNITKERFLELQQLFAQIMSEKEKMSAEIIRLKKLLTTSSEDQLEKPSVYKTAPYESSTTVKIVPQGLASQSGLPKLTNQPNVITGIIKDSSGNLLPNLIITISDKENVPVRAFKTNRLGQFAASTPLPNGIYILEIEDQKKNYQFNKIEITLTGQVMSPLEISAVNKRDLVRQHLTQELFGTNKI